MRKKHLYAVIVGTLFLLAGIQPTLAEVVTWVVPPPEGQTYPFGTWNPTTRTFTLTNNLDDSDPTEGPSTVGGNTIAIVEDHLTLDGAGYAVTGTSAKSGVVIDTRTDVTVKNLVVHNRVAGIRVHYSSNITLINNNLDNNIEGIHLFNSSDNTVTDNTSSNNEVGIYLYGSGDTNYSCSGNTLTGNTISNNARGIFLNRHQDATDNEVYNNRIYYNNIVANSLGIYLANVNNNQIYNNNIIGSTSQQVQVTGGSGNVFDLGESTGGNYWSDYAGEDTDGDGIGDTELPHHGLDNYPFMVENGWPTYTDTGSDVSVSDAESGVTVTFDNVDGAGITTCDMTDGGPPLPSGFRLLPVGIYYEINSTATYTGDITICINYDDSGMTEGQEGALKLKHYDETLGQWVDITTSLDTVNNIICGTVSSLSTFGVFAPIEPSNQVPMANAGMDQTVEQTSRDGAEVMLDGLGSSDPDGDALTYSWTWDTETATGVNPTVLLPLGTTSVTLVVNDGTENSLSDQVSITVQDTTPPDLAVPTDITVEQEDLDGTIVEFEVTATDICDAAPTVECTHVSGEVFPLGITTVTCTATDASGNSVEVTFDIIVEDTIPPEILMYPLPLDTILWPPNHRLVKVADISAIDNCDADAAANLVVIVTSNEPINGPGDGNTEPDWMWDDQRGELYVRAECSGEGDGRVYMIEVQCEDGAGNKSVPVTGTVAVPHDQGNGKK